MGLTPGNCKFDLEKVPVETENNDTEFANIDAIVREPVLENSEGQMLSQLTDLDDMDLPPGFSYPKPDNGNLETTKKEDVSNDVGQLEDANKVTPKKGRKRITKLKTPVKSSWVFRTKSQEKPKEPTVINETVNEESGNVEKKRRGRKKKQNKEGTVDEFLRMKTHLRYLLHRIKYEQYLIDAYSAEGWKGQSLEKLRPEKELERAKSHISRYKLRIRALFQQIDSALAVGRLTPLFDSKGEIDSEDIFCAKCGSKDLTLDNDIILCDGACERGFHQFCLDPPLLSELIPQGDEAWLCPGCDCKVICIDMLKDLHGTSISIVDTWEKIFPEEVAAASGKKLEDNAISSSDDSEDDDYDPDKPDTVEKVNGNKSCCDESNGASASEDAPTFVSPDDSDEEDDDFDPTAADSDEHAKKESSSSDFSSDSEDIDGLLGDSAELGKNLEQISPLPDETKGKSIKNELSYLVETSEEPVSGKRHVERLDYKKLHEETYVNYSSDSSDEDFGTKRRKVNREKSKVKSTSMTPLTNRELGTKDESTLLKDSAAIIGSASADTRSSQTWIGGDAKKRLYEYFNQNQYPEKAEKEKMANELGLTIIQVTRWFGHARWTFNHKSKPESNTIEKPPEPGPANGTDQVPQMQESVETSGKRKYRKRKPRKDTGDNVTITQNTQEQNAHI